MLLVYRISDAGYNKVKPWYINNENCLYNALYHFHPNGVNWYIIADNCSEETYNKIVEIVDSFLSTETVKIDRVSVGHGAGTFNLGLDYAIQSGEDYVYFLENDYFHRENSLFVLYEMLTEFKCDYATLYDAPDKYLAPSKGGNPFVDEDGAEVTKVYLGDYSHYKLCFSTTMTFGARVEILKQDYDIIKKYTSGTHPHDFQMFTELCKQNGRSMMCPIPGYATHGETAWLAPFYQWEKQYFSP